jgi:spore coat polysaccharide biosynthesis protein SpsF (cytidylyltransferase family)
MSFDLPASRLLQRVVERCRASRSMDELWVATTTEGADEANRPRCAQSNCACPSCSGSVDDVLDRYLPDGASPPERR